MRVVTPWAAVHEGVGLRRQNVPLPRHEHDVPASTRIERASPHLQERVVTRALVRLGSSTERSEEKEEEGNRQSPHEPTAICRNHPSCYRFRYHASHDITSIAISECKEVPPPTGGVSRPTCRTLRPPIRQESGTQLAHLLAQLSRSARVHLVRDDADASAVHVTGIRIAIIRGVVNADESVRTLQTRDASAEQLGIPCWSLRVLACESGDNKQDGTRTFK